MDRRRQKQGSTAAGGSHVRARRGDIISFFFCFGMTRYHFFHQACMCHVSKVRSMQGMHAIRSIVCHIRFAGGQAINSSTPLHDWGFFFNIGLSSRFRVRSGYSCLLTARLDILKRICLPPQISHSCLNKVKSV